MKKKIVLRIIISFVVIIGFFLTTATSIADEGTIGDDNGYVITLSWGTYCCKCISQPASNCNISAQCCLYSTPQCGPTDWCTLVW